MTTLRSTRWLLGAVLAALVWSPLGCGEGTVTFGRGDDDESDATVTVEGNLDDVSPVTTRNIVAFAYEVQDDSDRCPCPPDPSSSAQGRAAVLASGETEFSLSGLDAGAIGVVFLLDNAGDAADGEINPGDPIAVLDDVDCEMDDVDGNLTVTLEDVDILFSDTPTSDCEQSANNTPATGRARADQITKKRSTTGE